MPIKMGHTIILSAQSTDQIIGPMCEDKAADVPGIARKKDPCVLQWLREIIMCA